MSITSFPKRRTWCGYIFNPSKPYGTLFAESKNGVLYACWNIKYTVRLYAHFYVQFAHPLDFYEVSKLFDVVWQPPDGFELRTPQYVVFTDVVAGPFEIGLATNVVPRVCAPMDTGLDWLSMASLEVSRLSELVKKIPPHLRDSPWEEPDYIKTTYANATILQSLSTLKLYGVDPSVFREEKKKEIAESISIDNY